jgi:hypothetical protein
MISLIILKQNYHGAQVNYKMPLYKDMKSLKKNTLIIYKNHLYLNKKFTFEF